MQHKTEVSFPELALIAGTRGMAGAGIGLLLAGRLSTESRRVLGLALLGVGVLTTIPLAFEVLSHRTEEPSEALASPRAKERNEELRAH
jgi:hypothetical protein